LLAAAPRRAKIKFSLKKVICFEKIKKESKIACFLQVHYLLLYPVAAL
jgi:hypothetical protein